MTAAAIAGLVPISDLVAEGAVLERVLADPEALGRCNGLESHHFYSDEHRLVFSAARDLARAGHAIDQAGVVSLLREREQLERIGGVRFFHRLVEETPASLQIETHAERVRILAQQRRVQALCHRFAAEGYQPQGDVGDWAQQVSAELAEAAERKQRSIERLRVPDLFVELAPVPWLVRDLDIAPGAPVLVAGYGYSGKTVVVQDLAFAVASGGTAWSRWPVERGRVLHFDYEQGRRLTSSRYQRIAAAHGVSPDELGDRLAAVCLPALYLDDPRAEDVLSRELEGHRLFIVDSLRAAAPSLDENTSDVRLVLDMLTRVSERTGCVCLVVHHARKPSKQDQGGARMAIRGSGAIYDATSSVLVLEGLPGQPPTLSHQKARNRGHLAEDHELIIEDLDGGGLAVGLRPVPQHGAATPAEELAEVEARIVAVLGDNPGVSDRRLRVLVGGGRVRLGAALDGLLDRGVVRVEPGSNRAKNYHLGAAQ